MGRGRAKAKQTKVARQLKYNSGGTDLDRLAEELGVSSSRTSDEPYDEELDDPYASYAEGDGDEGGNGSESRRHR
jgi:Protein of unknown function (DUF3073)